MTTRLTIPVLKGLLPLALLTVCHPLQAQKDTSRRQTIDITSSYKPVLRDAVKINFSASHLPADTSKTVAPYNVPPQQLFFALQPSPLRPLAFTHDSLPALGIRNFIKAGFGNYRTPFMSAGFSFGDGRSGLMNVYADYISSRGSIQHQDYSQLNLKAAGSLFRGDHEFYGSASASQHDYHYYGYDHAVDSFSKKEVLQRFQLLQLRGGMRNRTLNGSGIRYNPHLDVRIFSNPGRMSEQSLVLTVPAEKTFGDALSIRLSAQADITGYRSDSLANGSRFSNNLYSLAPEIAYAKPLYNIHIGVTPVWNNGGWNLLPNIYGEAKLKDKIFLAQAGVVGRIIKNTYQHLTRINPWTGTLGSQINTRETEIYGGIKATVGDHFNFSAKASWITHHNLPFFYNDSLTGKTFVVVNEGKVSNLRLHGDLSFVKQDQFTLTGGLTFNGYTGFRDQRRAWGMLPLELNASLRWWAFKQVLIKGDFMAFNGAPVLRKDGTDFRLGGGADLSAGVEFQVNKRFSAWLDINNLFNNRYQRWYQYPVYGINFLAGVMMRF